MIDAQPPVLTGWDNFYVIVGSSAAALIGLQFVVIALVKDTRARTTSGTISAFGTPTVVHLAGALLASAVMSAPWPTLTDVLIALAITGLAGLAYTAQVIARARTQSAYTPVWEDWLWHAMLPGAAYAAITIAGLSIVAAPRGAAFAIAAAALGLLFIAIHNAWDTVTYMVIGVEEDATSEARPEEEREPASVEQR